jgi:hypothetical protein
MTYDAGRNAAERQQKLKRANLLQILLQILDLGIKRMNETFK